MCLPLALILWDTRFQLSTMGPPRSPADVLRLGHTVPQLSSELNRPSESPIIQIWAPL